MVAWGCLGCKENKNPYHPPLPYFPSYSGLWHGKSIHKDRFISSISEIRTKPVVYDQTLTSNCISLVWRQLMTGLCTRKRVKTKDSWGKIISCLGYPARRSKMKALVHCTLLALLFVPTGKKHLKMFNSFNHVLLSLWYNQQAQATNNSLSPTGGLFCGWYFLSELAQR